MNALADAELVHVFRFVETHELLTAVRGVCRRWRALALHPEAWRQRRVAKPAEVARALEVAPCLEYFEIDLEEEEHLGRILELAATTSCAARHLMLSLVPGATRQCVRAVRRQARLGRLRHLDIDTVFVEPRDAELLLQVCADLHLDVLELSLHVPDPTNRFKDVEVLPELPWGSGSVRYLRYGFHLDEDRLAERLLLARARNLEELAVTSAMGLSVPVLSALAGSGCWRLRRLSIPPALEMTALLDCPHITTLTLDFHGLHLSEHRLELVPPLHAYFPRATTLRELHLLYRRPRRPDDPIPMFNFDTDASVCTLMVELALVLASSGRSLLEELTLGRMVDSSPLGQLPAVVQGLPRLQRLTLWNAPPAEALDQLGLGGRGAALRRLDVMCACGSLSPRQVGAAARLVCRQPAMHARITCSAALRRRCGPCARLLGRDRALGLYAHPFAQPCKEHDYGVTWKRVTE